MGDLYNVAGAVVLPQKQIGLSGKMDELCAKNVLRLGEERTQKKFLKTGIFKRQRKNMSEMWKYLVE